MTAISSAPGNAVLNRADLYQQVTDTIIRQLEKGVIPWQCGWQGGQQCQPGMPLNQVTGKGYRGINIVLLWCAAMDKKYVSDQWGTFKQWQEQKEMVKKAKRAP